MGTVYQAFDTTLGRRLALKILPPHLVTDPERLRRFVQEARSASVLNHPNIVTIYEIGEAAAVAPDGREIASGMHFIAMELVEGATLRSALASRQLDLRRTIEHFTQIAEGLAAAHAAGIVHRDLKPENVMITSSGFAKVLDFGLAKLREGQPQDEGSSTATVLEGTRPGLILGTIGYMSPEQAEGRPVDHRSDIFSFGCMLYEAVSGAHPFAVQSTVDTLHRILHVEPPLPDSPGDLPRILRKCLAKDPEERYQSIKDLAVDLRDLRRRLESGALSSPGVAAAPGRTSSTRRRWQWTILLAAGLMAGVAAVVWWVWRSGQQRAGTPAPSLTITRLTSTGNVIDAVVSRDGKYFAYVVSEAGQQGIYLRQVTGGNAVPLVAPARVGFWGVTFSSDSTLVYYVVKGGPPAEDPTGTLYVMPALGGTRRKLLTGIDSNVSLSPDGRQITYLRADFPILGSSAVMVAGSDGSNPRPIARRQPPEFFAPGFFVAPSWSPDGRLIAAPVRNSEKLNAHIITIDAATGAERQLGSIRPSVSWTHWLPDGSAIVFVGREGAALGTAGQLWLMTFPDGDVRRITNDVLEYRNATVTADGRSLVTVASDFTAALWIASVDGSAPPRRIASEKYDGVNGVDWTPDGRLLYASMVERGFQIFSTALDGSDRRQLTVDGVNMWPKTSRDGRVTVFASTRSGEPAMWRMDPDGRNARQLTRAVQPSNATITADGKWLVFNASTAGAQMAWKMPVTGGLATPVVNAFLSRSAVSPDGRYVAGYFRSTPSSPIVLGVVSLEDGNLVKSFNAPFTTSALVRWTHDGQALLYTQARPVNIRKQPLAGGSPVDVTEFVEGEIAQFELSPDGREIVMSRGSQTRDAFLITGFRSE